MKHLKRQALSAHAEETLSRRTAKVRQATDPRTEAARLWKTIGSAAKTFREIRRTLGNMASGRERCMYRRGSSAPLEPFQSRGVRTKKPEGTAQHRGLRSQSKDLDARPGGRVALPVDLDARPGDAWHFLLIALPAYDVFCRTGDLEMQERTRRLVQRASFASVFAFMLEIADGPDATVLINNQDSLQAIHDHPEIRTWV